MEFDSYLAYEQRLDASFDWAFREGSMHLSGGGGVHETLRRLAKRLDEAGIDYAIAGGMALFFHGYRRFTEVVDVLVMPEGLIRAHDELEGRGYTRPFEQSRNLRDTETGVRIDFLVAGQYPGEGEPGPVAFPEPREVSIESDGVRCLDLPTLISLKLASGQASHRSGDLADVQRLIQACQLPEAFADQLDPTLQSAYSAKWADAKKSQQDEL